MKLVLFGEDVFSATVLQSLLDAKFCVELIVCPFYENDTAYKALYRIATENNIEFIREKNVNSETIYNKIKEINPYIIISVHLRKVLKKEIFSLAQNTAINVHPSLLPKYRGLSPQHQVLIHGEKESAVTIHIIEEGIDTGNIVIQQKFDIKPNDYIADVQFKMLAIYKTIMVDAVRLLLDDNFKTTPQSTIGESYFGAIKTKDRTIDINSSKQDVYNLIRAVSMPYEGAIYNEFKIWTADFLDTTKEAEFMKTYPDLGVYEDEKDENIILRLKDGILLSDDFEKINE